MRRLTITYGDTIIFDDDNIDQFQWSETTDGVAVTAKFTAPAAKPAGGLLDLLTAGRRQQTQSMIEQKRAELDAEKTDTRGEDDTE